MLNKLLDFIAPHHCYGCQKIGVLLCDNCKYDIKYEANARCLRCQGPTEATGLCGRCAELYDRAWWIGYRTEALERLIDGYKFYNTKDSARLLGSVLAEVMPALPLHARLVPIPTIAAHRRMRGYDHTALMARSMQRYLGCQLDPLLSRRTQTVQRGATRQQRLTQAMQAFCLPEGTHLDSTTPYIIVDDVYTTGATVDAAAQLLRGAGAQTVWVAMATREPLDDEYSIC